MNHYFARHRSTLARDLGALLLVVPMMASAALSGAPSSPVAGPQPSPDLEPAEVVRLQVEALRSNGPGNEGIEVTFRFASPGNKRSTGPLGRFIGMVRSAPYDRLLNHRDADYGPVAVSDAEAYQIVTITDRRGEQVAYLWVLSRQAGGEYDECWMTDSVIPTDRPPPGRSARAALPAARPSATSR